MTERYFALSRDQLRGKAQDQIRKWRNPRIKAVTNLIAVIGDKALANITRNDALLFREWWQNRVETDQMDPGTANNDIGYLNSMINDVSEKLRLGLDQPFARMRLKGERHSPRQPFAPDFVETRLLAPGALDGLNEQARLAVYTMIETGLRPSEIVSLTTDVVILDAEVPHAQVRPKTRQLKTWSSERDIPLVGISLAAIRCAMESFDGFPRYREQPDNLSAAVNSFLHGAGLRPTSDHSLYSLRHTFEDRLTAVEPPQRVLVELMGHAQDRPKYGHGPSLEQKQIWLKKIEFRVSHDAPPSEILAPFLCCV